MGKVQFRIHYQSNTYRSTQSIPIFTINKRPSSFVHFLLDPQVRPVKPTHNLIVLYIHRKRLPYFSVLIIRDRQKPRCVLCPHRNQQCDFIGMQRGIDSSYLQWTEKDTGEDFLHVPPVLESIAMVSRGEKSRTQNAKRVAGWQVGWDFTSSPTTRH